MISDHDDAFLLNDGEAVFSFDPVQHHSNFLQVVHYNAAFVIYGHVFNLGL